MKTLRIISATFVALFATAGAFWAGAAAVALGQPAYASTPEQLVLMPETLQARAAVLYEPETGALLFQKNAHTPLPLASLTKLMTIQTVLAHKSNGEVVYIDERHGTGTGVSPLRHGEPVAINDLARLGLVASSNAAVAAAAASMGDAYLNEMNRAARERGLTKTYFLNPTGLDINDSVAGAYGSAFDVARMASAFLRQHGDLFGETGEEQEIMDALGRQLVATPTAAPIAHIEGFIGAKTGYTDLAGGNLVAAFEVRGKTYIAAVLGSTREGRFNDIATLIEQVRKQL